MLQDSVPAGSYNDPFLSSVIPFTHFNLVIRLSKVQLALSLCTFSQSLADPAVPGFLANAVFQEHPETSFFRSSFYSYITRDRTQAGTRLLGVVFFLLMVLW